MRRLALRLLPCCLAMLAAWPGQALAVKVVIDAGHGGSDPGAIGINKLQEKYVNLDVAVRLRDELARRGYETVMTRDTDVFLSLAERVRFTDREQPDLFVSVHSNWYTNPATRGTMVLYYDKAYPQASYPPSDAMAALTPESKRLAQAVQDAMLKEAGTVDKGLNPNAAYVVRMGSVPSILVETAFLSNAQDAANLADAAFRAKLAKGIANGVEAYIPASESGVFRDLPATHWAYQAIVKLQKQGIVEGEYGRFFPERALTRAEFVAMLGRHYKLPEPKSGSGGTAGCDGSNSVTGSTYGTPCTKPTAAPKDLPASHWAYGDMLQAVTSGLLDGYADGTLRPDRPITRGEAAALIDRVVWPNESRRATSIQFSDVPIDLWSAASINRLKLKGIVDGYGPNTFAPEKAITRAEMSAILDRLLDE